MMCGILRGMIKQNRCQKKDTRWKALYPGGKSLRQHCKNTKVQAGFVVANGLRPGRGYEMKGLGLEAKSLRQYCKNTKVQAGFVVANGLAGQRIRNERLEAKSLRLLQRKICLQLACYFLNNSIDF
jgi:hypothetical protein